VRFSIVTPSFRQLSWLQLCVRSVADQGVDFEHWIEDAGTGPELDSWVRTETTAQLEVAPDDGIYDALNRGFAKATGEIFAWLNCDEQYLPGALQAVAERFAADPALDVLLADNLVVNAEGRYLAHRFSLQPVEAHCWLRFPVSSCALFFRRRVWRPFDTRWKSAGDWWWFMEMLRSGAKIDVLRRFVATFGETGENVGLSPVTRQEHAAIRAARPRWIKALAPWLLARHRLRMWQSGAYRVAPFDYAMYVPGKIERVSFQAARPTARWRRGK
jgi:glycosyltransferase involved in cell wall biosynthesis